MKSRTLDIHMMKPKMFPYSVSMEAEMYTKRQGLLCERESARFRTVAYTWRNVISVYREVAERHEWTMTFLSTLGVCAFGLLAVGIFWLAVEMDNSDLIGSQTSSCVIKR